MIKGDARGKRSLAMDKPRSLSTNSWVQLEPFSELLMTNMENLMSLFYKFSFLVLGSSTLVVASKKKEVDDYASKRRKNKDEAPDSFS